MSEKPHILIVKTSAIGDVIHVFAVLDYLRDKFPQAQIDWVVEKPIAQLLSAHPQLSHVIPIDSRKWRANLFSRTTAEQWRLFFRRLRQTQYDVLFDLQGNCKSALITACARAVVKVGFGYKSVREKLNLLATNRRIDIPQEMAVRDMYLQLVKNYYRDFSNRSFQAISLLLTVEERERLRVILSLPIFHKAPLLMVAFGSKWPNKQLGYPFLHKFISRVAERYHFSFLFIYANQEEKQIAQALSLALSERAHALGELTLPLWQSVMGHVAGVVTVDSAALHLCATTTTPSFSFFGPSHSHIYKPPFAPHVAIQGSCPYDQKFVRHCPQLRTCSTGACMKHFEMDKLMQDFEDWVVKFM